MKLFYLQDSISFLQKQSLRADIQGYLKHHGGKFDKRLVTRIKNSSIAFAFAIGHWPISLL
jgi:hypothetical protein